MSFINLSIKFQKFEKFENSFVASNLQMNTQNLKMTGKSESLELYQNWIYINLIGLNFSIDVASLTHIVILIILFLSQPTTGYCETLTYLNLCDKRCRCDDVNMKRTDYYCDCTKG